MLGTIYVKEDVPLVADQMIAANKKKLESGTAKVRLRDLFGKRYRVGFLVAIVVCIIQQVSGVNFLIFYTKNFFDEVSNNGATMNLLLGVMNILGGFLGVPLIASFGRRFNLISSCMFMSVAMALLAWGVSTSSQYICMVAVMMYMLNFAYGLGGTLSVYIAEIVPPLGVGIATAV